jgi:hypothetical protein
MRSTLLVLSLSLPFGSLHAQEPPRKPLKHDAGVEAIIVPSDDARYAEHNPAVHEPRVVIRNDGTYPLAGISIRYGTEGFQMRMFAWTGHLATGATAEVTLPHLIDMRPGQNTFTVVLGDPNGKKDKDKTDNTRSTTFTAAPALGSPITVRLRTPIGNGGTLRVESTRGPILLDWKWNARMDTVLRETLFPPNGSYFLTVADSGRVGGPATVRVLDAAGEPIKSLQSRARGGTKYQFRVDTNAPEGATFSCATDVLQRPGRGAALVEVHCAAAGEVVIRDLEDEPVDGWAVPAGQEVMQVVDLSAQKSGTYRVFFRQGEEEQNIGSIVVP